MDYALVISIGAVVLVLAAFWFIQKQRPTTVSDAAALVVEAERVARILVWGAQQVYESDQTDGVDQRYEQVESTLLELFPNLEAQHAKQVIEGAVFGMKLARERGWLPASAVREIEL